MMMKFSVLVIAIWLSAATARRLTTRSVLDNEISNSAELDIPDKSWVTVKAVENEIKVLIGEPVEIECEASGSPAPLIQFYRDATELTKNEIFANEITEYPNTGLAKAKGRLRFIAKKTEVIFCRANSGSKAAHAAIKVYVSSSKLNLLSNDIWGFRSKEEIHALQKAPRITFFDTMYLDNIGSTVTLPCAAVGAGEIDIIWLNSTEYVIENGGDKRFSVTPSGSLKIKNIRWSDMGPYTCVARNSYGQDKVTTFLYPMLADK